MTAADLAATIASRFETRQGIHAAHAQTGDEYVPFEIRCRPDQEDEACETLRIRILGYVEGWSAVYGRTPAPTLYWRYDPPHVFWYADDDPGAPLPARLSTRLVLSRGPVVYPTLGDYDAARTAQIARQILNEGKNDG